MAVTQRWVAGTGWAATVDSANVFGPWQAYRWVLGQGWTPCAAPVPATSGGATITAWDAGIAAQVSTMNRW